MLLSHVAQLKIYEFVTKMNEAEESDTKQLELIFSGTYLIIDGAAL